MQALKFVLVSAVALVGLSVLVKAGGYGRGGGHYPMPIPYAQPSLYAVRPPIQRYAVVPVGGIGGGFGGIGGGFGGGFGGGLGGFGGNGLFFLIIVIVFVFILLGSDLFEED